jgi:translocator protein
MKWVRFVFAILICQFVGYLGSLFTTPNLTWFAGLVRPSFAPPDWLFAPVWISLFVLMGISLFLVWDDEKLRYLFYFQLGLNILWSIFFFGLHNPALAFIELILLWIFILIAIIKFFKVSKWASGLMIPYFLWVTFAGVLNFWYVLIN